jgi:predicted dehydrogenase
MSFHRTLIIGYGSIGRRHERLLRHLDLQTAVVSGQKVDAISYPTIVSALDDWHPDYVVVASPTSRHARDFAEIRLAGFKGTILVEKPVVANPSEIIEDHMRLTYVGYNLRFLPAIAHLRDLVSGQQVHTVGIWNAQYLPEWRPGRDYRTTSSASLKAGGGVLRDLSHDLDFVDFLFGKVTSVFGLIGKYGSLEIDTEDTAQLVMSSERCRSISIYLSYLDRQAKHAIRLTTSDDSIECNLLTGELQINGRSECFSKERDETFLAMHRAIIGNDTRSLCTLEDAMRTVRVIDASELSARERRIVTL